MAEKRSTFAPVVLLGLASGALAAVASAKAWVEPQGSAAALAAVPGDKSAATMPLAGALSLLLLATWGILLVTRGWVRRGLAVLAALTAVGLVVTVIAGHHTLPGQLIREDLGTATGAAVGFTGWFWVALVGAVVSVPATLLAVRFAGEWPAMGSRYDAPGAQRAVVEPTTNQELWKAIDEGHDPTLRRDI